MGLTFYPLYWVYHDFWDYTQTSHTVTPNGTVTKKNLFNHFGHMHFFIPQIDIEQTNSQQAYSGFQTYNFSLEQLWGPKSNDINQQNNFKVIGKPKWYFYIEQYWRRVYIQNWDYKTNAKDQKSFLGKRGIKYDASKAYKAPYYSTYDKDLSNVYVCKQGTIYRQTKDNYFFYSDLCRTLPIQYWQDKNKRKRDHYLRLNNASTQYQFFYNWYKTESNSKKDVNIVNSTWDFDKDYPTLIDKTILPKYDPENGYVNYTDFYTHYDQFTIPRNIVADGDPNYDSSEIVQEEGTKFYKVRQQSKYKSFCDQSGARVSTYPDRYYISPTIQYQKVIQKNWQRLDGWQQRDVQDQQSGNVFGDGYQYTITIPYSTTIQGSKKIMSPFSDDNGFVYGAGIYQHNVVKQQDKLRINAQKKDNGQLIFNNYELQLLYKQPRKTWSRPMIQDLGGFDHSKGYKLTQFSYPYAYKPYLDGMWVQQCLGAVVKARVKVITQDNYGGRRENWVSTTASQSLDPFVGKQQ